jgi:quinoprotein glucose dehydrogenase
MKRIVIATVCALFVASQMQGPNAHAHFAAAGAEVSSQAAGADWAVYHGNPNGTHYSVLDQINTQNVKGLKVAWTFETGDGLPTNDMEGDTIVVKGRMYFASPKGRIFSLNAATGAQNWVYDPAEGKAGNGSGRLRGVCYWTDGTGERILFTSGNRLIAVDANSGKLIESFGDSGKVDLTQNLGRDPHSVSVNVNSPGVIFKDLIILGSTGATPGHIRAYSVRTGKLAWIFHTIPQPGEFGYDTWPKDAWKTANGANVWSGLSLDPERGIVYLPVASAGMGFKDFYGADREGDTLFGTSLVALDANTGRRLWHYQFVKHDLWDRDPPTPATLVTVHRDGKDIPAVAQITKYGYVWVFDRVTGENLFPTQEVPVFPSTIPGEKPVTHEILPAAPEPFARQRLTEQTLTQRTPAANAAVREHLATMSNRGRFDPPSLEGTVIFPGLDGGGEYGGAAWDPTTGILYINSNEQAYILKLRAQVKTTNGSEASAGEIYSTSCAGCHGLDRKGNPPAFPALLGVTKRMTSQQIEQRITNGSGRMPGFEGTLTKTQIEALTAFISDDNAKPESTTDGSNTSVDYIFQGYTKFLDPDGYPAVSTPWGTLNALNLNTGKYVWQIPFGEYPELKDPTTGSENYGGGIVTKGGVFFIAATVYDNKVRAFDKLTGKLLWEDTMAASGVATPSTYAVDGKQYFAVSSGGGKNPKVKNGGAVIAYALP